MKRILLLTLAIALAACTKEVPYKEAPKDEKTTPKTAISTNAEFVYVVTNGESSRTSPGARPFWMGDSKLVKFQFTENSLQVLQLEPTNLFRLNPTNSKLLLEIPVSHVDYECAKDQFGECTNQEQENQKTSWKDKAYFKPQISNMKVAEISVLPVELQNYFDEPCYDETGSRLLDYELTPEAVNIKIEKSFRVNGKCLDPTTDDLAEAIFSAVYHYSMVRVDKIASPNYKPVEYPQYDEDEIGFFTSEMRILDPDNRDVEIGKKVFMNRWNPEKGTLVYNLSKAFFRPHNRAILEATKLGIARVNSALAQAHSNLQIELKDGSKLEEGDIRNNFIILVDDPLAQGVIGYGPSVPNPITGEILSGRVVMYGGTLKKYIKNTYDEFVEREQSLKVKTEGSLPPQLTLDESLIPGEKKGSLVDAVLASDMDLGSLKISDLAIPKEMNNSSKLTINPEKAKRELLDYTSRVDDRKSTIKSRLEAMSDHCAWPAELVNFEQAVAEALKKITNGELVPWTDLPEAQKALIVDTVLPFVWVPTLVHEVGHNLGLRHNFAGSEDKANFYSKEELETFGIDHDITYSSVMDYPARTLNELPAMGKYDIMALRFAYAREIEVNGKGFVPVPTTLKATDAKLASEGEERRSFRFCTDEHVSVNPGCKRFDEGTSFTEIAQHFIDTYNKEYHLRHFRNGLRKYSMMNDFEATMRLNYTFYSLRGMFEMFERFNSDFNIPEELWKTHPLLKDVRGAADLAAVFFTEMQTTPDTTCALSRVTNPGQIVAVAPLDVIDPEAISCFDDSVQQGLMEQGYFGVGEGGRSFKSKKAPDSDNHWADQIDQRGIWLEKALATEYLWSRGLGNSVYDKNRKNFTSYGRYQGLVLGTTLDMLLSNVESVTDFTMITGQVLPLQFVHSPMDGHKIREAMDPRVKQLFDLPDDDMWIDNLMLNVIGKRVPSRDADDAPNAQAVSEIFQVYPQTATSGHSSSEFEKTDIGTKRYFALKNNVVALLAIRTINAQRDLKEMTKEKVEKILAALKAGKPVPGNSSAIERRVYKLDPALIQAFLDGDLKSEAYLGRLLSLLPKAI